MGWGGGWVRDLVESKAFYFYIIFFFRLPRLRAKGGARAPRVGLDEGLIIFSSSHLNKFHGYSDGHFCSKQQVNISNQFVHMIENDVATACMLHEWDASADLFCDWSKSFHFMHEFTPLGSFTGHALLDQGV